VDPGWYGSSIGREKQKSKKTGGKNRMPHTRKQGKDVVKSLQNVESKVGLTRMYIRGWGFMGENVLLGVGYLP